MALKTGPTISLVFTVLIGLIGMILSIVSYSKWQNNADDYAELLNNWKTLPVTNITLVAPTESCPPGYGGEDMGKFYYQKVSCVGENNTSEYYCDAPTPARDGTDTWNTIATYTNYIWNGARLCLQREGVNAVDRPLKSKSGYKSCGTNSETGEYFFNENHECPITYFGTTIPSTGNYSTLKYGSYTYYMSRDPTYGRPFLQFETGEGNPCFENSEKFDGVRGSNQDPYGLNVSGIAFTVSNTAGDIKNPFRTTHPKAGNCVDNDRRFVTMDSVTEYSILNDNLKTNGGEIPLSSYVFASDSSNVAWTRWNRPEILWKESCPYTREQVSSVETVVNVVTATTLAVMILSISGAIFDCAFEGWAFNLAHDNDDSNDDEAAYWQKFGNCCCTLGTLITTIVSFIFISTARAFFDTMKEGNCSDPQTNEVIGYLAKTIDEFAKIWIAKLTFDILKICYYLYCIFKGRDRLMNKASV